LIADDGEHGGVSGLIVGGQGGGEGGGGVHGGVVDGGDDVVDLQAGLLGAGALGHVGDGGASGDAVELGLLIDLLHLDAQVGLAGDIAVLDQVGEDLLHVVDGEGEAQALGGHAG